MEAQKAELQQMISELNDLDMLKKIKASIKRITKPKEDPFFTNSTNLAHFRKSVEQRERGGVDKGEVERTFIGLSYVSSHPNKTGA